MCWTTTRLRLLLAVVAVVVQCSSAIDDLRAEWKRHTALEVAEHKLTKLVRLSDNARFSETLSHLIVPRIVGTPEHEAVKQYIIETMQSLGWHIETDKFEDTTPNLGRLEFENVIATLNPSAKRQLVLACHYDSKYFADGTRFEGASDSAVPCAMLIDMAEVLHGMLMPLQQAPNGTLGLQLVFFDGEEAFHEWSDADSLYGARHLAQRWQDEKRLERIDMMVLLDLLGMPDPHFYSLQTSTESWYARFVDVEQRLAHLDLVQRDQNSGIVPLRPNAYFQPQSIHTQIDDDHKPFMQRGVPIVHLIPVPFPHEWHTADDSRSAIDMVTVDNLNRILRVFVVEYLHLVMP